MVQMAPLVVLWLYTNMKELRPLTREEMMRLLKEAPEHETKFIRESGLNAYEFFNNNSIVIQGLIIDGRPIYIAAVIKNKEDKYVFWTVVNSNVKDKFSLCKYSKRELKKWLNKFGCIYATMPKGNILNQKWTEWLGFNKLEEDNDTITYRLGE